MADPNEIDSVADAFRSQIEPERAPTPPRNARGQFTETQVPERMFAERRTEGDPVTGDTSDAGDDKRLRSRERQVQEGADDGESGSLSDEEREALNAAPEEGGEDAAEAGNDGEGEDDDGEVYEVVVDGEQKKVKLREALDGYIRTETFHQRMNKLSEVVQIVNTEAQKNEQLRQHWIARNQQLDAEITGLMPQEPNWDEEFARDPQAAHQRQKQYEFLRNRQRELRDQRAQVEQQQQQEQQQNIARYAANERERFINRHKLTTKEAVDKEIASMRKTAMAEGFSEDEVAQVYDSRMLTVLLKASKYDRMMAAKPKAVIPGKGRTLTPGSVSARQSVGRSGREGIDVAQRKLAASGSVDDAASFFQTVLRR